MTAVAVDLPVLALKATPFAIVVYGLLARPRLARVAADIPVTLYFVGFVGGVLTLGPVGFVVGLLVVALLVETVALLVETVALLSTIELLAGNGDPVETTEAASIPGIATDTGADGPGARFEGGDVDADGGFPAEGDVDGNEDVQDYVDVDG